MLGAAIGRHWLWPARERALALSPRWLAYRCRDIARNIPFLFSTGYDRGRLRDGYRSFAMLQKPFHSKELAKVLMALFAPAEPLPSIAA